MPGDFVLATLLPCLLSGILIGLWPRKWTASLCYPQPAQCKSQARKALIVLAAIFVLTTLLIALAADAYGDPEQREYTLGDVVGQAVVWAIILVPMFIGAKTDSLGWQDLQYRWSKLLPAVVLGTLVGGIFLVSAGKADRLPGLFTANGLFATLQYLIVGFAEETLFRGYAQTRWAAAWGWWPGFLLASVGMVLFHAPILLLAEQLSFQDMLLEVLRMLPLSLLLGLAMHKSGNIAAPGIIHLWLNVIQTL
jgi:membrane protease YdiL (CAAX protease family)